MPEQWDVVVLRIHRSLIAAVVVSFAAATLVPSAAPAATVDRSSSPKGGPVGRAEVPDLAKGLIVRTTTAAPSESLLDATDEALDSAAEVVDDDRLLTQVSTVDFDQAVPAAVAESAAAEIAERSDVVWASPNRLRQVQADPPIVKNDQLFGRQHNLWNRGYSTNRGLSVPSNGGYSIKAPSLWRKTEGSSSTVVAVIDTGIINHPDLPASKRVDGADLYSDLSLDNDGDPGRDNDPTDPGDWYASGDCPFTGSGASSWHGTFVAGQVAAATDNGAGIAAVAPNVTVQPIRALGRCGGWDSDIVDAMKWAAGIHVSGVADNPTPATVVNLSLAGAPVSAAQREADCRIYNEAARLGKARGTIYVAAAGNDGGNANRVTPASCSELVSVGATSINGFSALYSNVGSTVDLVAPGGDTEVDPYTGSDQSRLDIIWSLGDRGKKGQAGYVLLGYQGTSMAAPQVAGAAALLHSLGLTTPTEMTNALYASVTPARARSKVYADKAVGPDRYDLNCTSPGRQWCGRGLLDLSRVQVPLSKPVITGTPTVGEPLTATLGSWVRTPSSPTYTWKVDGITKGTSRIYWPTSDDVGRSITVTVAPSTPAFRKLTSTSSAVTVPAGPAVVLTGPASSPTYGSAFSVVVQAPGDDAPIEIRADDGTVVATGTSGSGTSTIEVPGRALKPGTTSLRAAYLGSTAGSSPRTTVTVRRLAAKVSTSLRSEVRATSRATLKVEVLERPDLFTDPTGELRVYDGSRRILTTRLSSTSNGRKSILLPKLSRGTHRIKVYFRDSDVITSTYSVVRTIRSS